MLGTSIGGLNGPCYACYTSMALQFFLLHMRFDGPHSGLATLYEERVFP